MQTLWQKLPKPFTILAPMEDVTDTVFRRIVAACARPDVFFTEFTSVDGLFSRGREEVIHRFDFTEEEHPVVAQIWGRNPDLFYKAAKLIADLGFDGVDINLGCPERNVIQHGCGAKLIGETQLVSEIIHAAKEGAGELPISIKTRLGYKKVDEDWIPFLLEQKLDALTIHGRTAAEMSKVPAHWDEIGKYTGRGTIIIGNGDVENYQDAMQKSKLYRVEGIMIGRGIFHDLWAFDKSGISYMGDHKKMLGIMRSHIRLFTETWGNKTCLPAGRNFAVMKKFFKIYVQGFPHASEIREELMETENADEVEKILSGLVIE